MLSGEDLGIKVSVVWRRERLGVRLASYPKDIGKDRNVDGLSFKGAVHRDETQHWTPFDVADAGIAPNAVWLRTLQCMLGW